MQWIQLKALDAVIPFILPPLVYFASRFILNAFTALEALPPATKRIVVVVVALVANVLLQLLKVAIPEACGDMGTGVLTSDCTAALSAPTFVKALLTAGMAMFLHALKKAHPEK